MEVDEAAPLVLGHLRVRQPDRVREGAAREPAPARQDAPQLQREAVPQLPRLCLPQHGTRVVVAARAQRLTQSTFTFRVPYGAPDRHTVRAAFLGPTGTAGPYPTILFTTGMHRAEARRGQRREHARVAADLWGDLLAAHQPGPDELVGVGPVHAGAGRADRRTPVAAGHEQPTAVRPGAVGVQHLARRPVDGNRAADKMYGIGAAVEADDVAAPGVEVGASRTFEQGAHGVGNGGVHRSPPKACRMAEPMASGLVFAENR